MAVKVINYDDRLYELGELEDFEAGLLKRTIEIADQAKQKGNHPFGALLADGEGRILLEQENDQISGTDCTAHAETALIRKASGIYSREELEKFTLYSCCEPCCMCTGAMYWSGLGRMVYACRESKLKECTGDDPRNPTLDLPCRAVIACGQRNMEILGPFPELEPMYLKLHKDYWGKEE